MTTGQITVSLVALCRSRPQGIAGIKVPDGETLAADGGRCADLVVVGTVGRPHERWADADDAHQGLFHAPPEFAM